MTSATIASQVDSARGRKYRNAVPALHDCQCRQPSEVCRKRFGLIVITVLARDGSPEKLNE